MLRPEIELHLVSHRRNKALRLIEMLWAVLRYGRAQQPVIIDVYSTLNFYYALFTGLLCRMFHVHYCCVLHGGNLPARLNQNPQLCRLLFGGAQKNIAPSAYLLDAFQKAGYTTQLIPNFIPIKNYPFQLRAHIRPRLLWVRAFDATYHPEMAIRLLASLSESHPDARLCMVGPDKDGSLSRCQALAEKLGVAEKVRFTGRLSKADWVAFSAGYDIFINTTNYDNTPVSVMEAMALGFPIVSTNAGGLPYLIEEGQDGLLVEKGDVEGMVKAIRRLLEESGLAGRLSARARAKAEGFDAEVVLGQWVGLLGE